MRGAGRGTAAAPGPGRVVRRARPGQGLNGGDSHPRTCTIFGPRKGQRRPGRVDPLLSLERPDDDPLWQRWNTGPAPMTSAPVRGDDPPGRAAPGRASVSPGPGPLRPPVRARRLRGGPGGRSAGPPHPHPGAPGHLGTGAPGPPRGHRERGGQWRRRRHPHPGAPRLLRRRRGVRPPGPGRVRHRVGLPVAPRPRGRGGPHGHRQAGRARRASRSSAGATCRSTTPPSAPSPRRPCPRSTSCSWPRPGNGPDRGRSGAGRRPAGLRPAQAGRARDRPVLPGVAVGPDHHLQGHADLPSAGRVLSRTSPTSGSSAGWPWSTRASPPTPSRRGPWPTPTVTWPTTARSTPWPATATGCVPGRPCAPRP